MSRKRRYRSILITLLLMLAVQPQVESAGAEGHTEPFEVTSFQQTDTRGDGRPDLAEILCRCYSENDRILVVDGAGDMQPASTFEAGTDMENDLWLFDVGNRGFFQLAIQFNREGDHLAAEIYHDRTGDGQVRVTTGGGRPSLAEPGFPPVRVVALSGEWPSAGRVDHDLDIFVDGPVRASFDDWHYSDNLRNDGTPDISIRVRGPSEDDERTYELRTVELPLPLSTNAYRSQLGVRDSGLEPPVVPIFPWHLLGGPGRYTKSYGVTDPPIQVDWENARIDQIGEFVATRGGDSNWFTYSVRRVMPGQITEPDFESPFGFYRLSDRTDGVPDLQVRVERSVPDSNRYPPQWRGRNYQMVRYSWEQSDDRWWTYKVGLLGQHEIDQLVEFPEFTLRTIPYEELPDWVISREWDIASFIAVEKDLYVSDEGIYEWGLGSELRDDYYAGVGTDGLDQLAYLPEGLRGEYSLRLGGQPWLYFSPVDARLHLVGAESGMYNINDHRWVHYENLTGDDYIDYWALSEDDELLSGILQFDDHLLYFDRTKVSILPLSTDQETFRTLPPTNQVEWTKLDAMLDTKQREFRADDLEAMFNQFPGEPLVLHRGTTRDLRLVDGGYRFVLELEPGYDLGEFPITGVDVAGSYVAHYDISSKEFFAQPWSAPSPAIDSITLNGTLESLRTVDLTIHLSNTGMEDLSVARLTVTAENSDRQQLLIANETVELLGDETQVFAESWVFPEEGTWSITARLRLPGGGEIERTSDVEISQSPGASWRTGMSVGWPETSPWLYLAALAGLVLLPAGGGVIIVRRFR